MTKEFDRRELVALASLGGLGIAFGSALGSPALAQTAAAPAEDFFFVHLADTHWGFKDDKINPDAEGTMKKVIAGINGLSKQPEFIVFTGDMTHTTNDGKQRRQRMSDVRGMLGELRVKDIKYVPGDHDAGSDRGEAYQEFFGKLYYTFDHKGYHFIVLDNVSGQDAKLGTAQLQWLAADLKQLAPNTPVVVLTHKPLFELYKPYGWFTPDGIEAMDLLKPFKATVLYGHIHHEHHTMANGLMHHATSALMIPLYPAGTRPERTPRPWNPKSPYAGMAWRTISALNKGAAWDMEEQAVVKG